jgi:hypothetical protein
MVVECAAQDTASLKMYAEILLPKSTWQDFPDR